MTECTRRSRTTQSVNACDECALVHVTSAVHTATTDAQPALIQSRWVYQRRSAAAARLPRVCVHHLSAIQRQYLASIRHPTKYRVWSSQLSSLWLSMTLARRKHRIRRALIVWCAADAEYHETRSKTAALSANTREYDAVAPVWS